MGWGWQTELIKACAQTMGYKASQSGYKHAFFLSPCLPFCLSCQRRKYLPSNGEGVGWGVGLAMTYIPPSCPELSPLPHSHFSFFPSIVRTHASFSPSVSPLPPLYALALDYTHAYTLIVSPLTRTTLSCSLFSPSLGHRVIHRDFWMLLVLLGSIACAPSS